MKNSEMDRIAKPGKADGIFEEIKALSAQEQELVKEVLGE